MKWGHLVDHSSEPRGWVRRELRLRASGLIPIYFIYHLFQVCTSTQQKNGRALFTCYYYVHQGRTKCSALFHYPAFSPICKRVLPWYVCHVVLLSYYRGHHRRRSGSLRQNISDGEGGEPYPAIHKHRLVAVYKRCYDADHFHLQSVVLRREGEFYSQSRSLTCVPNCWVLRNWNKETYVASTERTAYYMKYRVRVVL